MAAEDHHPEPLAGFIGGLARQHQGWHSEQEGEQLSGHEHLAPVISVGLSQWLKWVFFQRQSDDTSPDHPGFSSALFTTAFNIAVADPLPNRFWTHRMYG
jgi:hypothetical protein